MTLAQLRGAGRDIATGFSVTLSSGDVLVAQQVLRILPGRRLVFVTQYQGKICAAKLFLHEAIDSEAVRRERDGYACLQEGGIVTPELYACCAVDNNAAILLYAFVSGVSLQDAWDTAADVTHKQQLLSAVYSMLASGHDHGVMQEDLHPGNFLVTNTGLCMLDPGLVYRVKATDTAALRDNLAMLVAQFPRADHALALSALTVYLMRRKTAVHFTVDDVAAGVSSAWQQRRKQFLQKIFRDCSYNIHVSERGHTANYVRAAYNAALAAVLHDPDAAIAAGRILKDGTSSTVAVVQVNGHTYVCKRYHNASRWVAFRRSFMPSRARNAWYFAHLLHMLGVGTPRPVAMLECQRSRCDHSSYFISEAIDADNAYNVFTQHGATPLQVATIAAYLRTLADEGVVHGDCKSTNWLVAHDSIWLVDLDSMHEDKRAVRKREDVARFMADWQAQPVLRAEFATAFDITAEATT